MIEATKYNLETGEIVACLSVSSQELLELNLGEDESYILGHFDPLKFRIIEDEPVPIVQPDPAYNLKKSFREQLLYATDWMAIRHRDQIEAGIENPSLSSFDYGKLLDYRQALRDWPLSGDYNEPFPAKPEWMA